MRHSRIRRCPSGLVVAGALAISASPAPRPTSDDATECATQLDVPEDRMLPLTRFDPLRQRVTSMSKRGEQFTGPGCPRVDVIAPSSCAVTDFPWVRSPSTQARDLLSRGVTSVLRAEYGVDDQPVLSEVVLEAAPGRSVDEVYREHLATCGATVRVSENGRPTRWTLGDRDELAVAVTESAAVVVLISHDERVEAFGLLDEAVRLAG